MRARSTRLIWPFLGHDHHDRVGLFGDAQRGAVPRAEALGLDGRLGQRQQHARRQQGLAADDHGPVVERGPRRKIVRIRSAETSPWIITPVSAASSRPVSRSRTISAPCPSAESSAAARATSLATWSTARASAPGRTHPIDPTRPILSSARRISGWKITTSANRPTTAPPCRIG